MNKTDLVKEVANRVEMTQVEVKRVVDTLLDVVHDGVVNDGKVTLQGFGNFVTKIRKARTVRNPQTGEPMDVPEKRVVVFKPSTVLKEDLVNSL